MKQSRQTLDFFLSIDELKKLSQYEQFLYQKCFEFEQYKFQSDPQSQAIKKTIEALLPKSDWGLFVFKPPRASLYLKDKLQKSFFALLMLGFMAVDINGAKWARQHLPWLLK